MEQTFMNILLSAVSGLLGFIVRSLWGAVRELQAQDSELVKRLGEIEVVVAGEYVRKIDFDRRIDAIFHKLDRIEEKIDRKADK